MAVVAFIGSPRKKGNTETLIRAVARGVEQAGGKIEIVRLCELDIAPCLGCGGCDKTGKCVVEDDMTGLYDKLLNAGALIIASPVYFYSVSAQTKTFIDRLQAMWARKQLLMAKGEWREDPGRRGYLVSVAATRGEKVFVGAQLCVRYVYDALGFVYAGDLLVRGADSRGEVKKVQKSMAEAEKFGAGMV